MNGRLPHGLLKASSRIGLVLADVSLEDATVILLHHVEALHIHETEAWARFVDRRRKRTGKSPEEHRKKSEPLQVDSAPIPAGVQVDSACVPPGGVGGVSISRIQDPISASPISSESLSNPVTSPGARDAWGRHPPRDTVAGAVPREAGVLVHGALPPNADWMVGVYESAVARGLGLPRWSMGTRRRENAEAVARILDDWAWDDAGTPLEPGDTRREAWLRLNVEHYCREVVRRAQGTERAQFVTPSSNCFVRWLNETAASRAGAQNDPDLERELAADRGSGVRAAGAQARRDL